MFEKLVIFADNCCGKIPTDWFSQWFYDRLMFPDLGLSIAKYAVCILTGIIVAYLVQTPEGEKMGIRKDDVLTIAIITVPLCVIGGRIVYMLTDGESTFATKIATYGFFPGLWGGLLSVIGFYNAPADYTFGGISGMAMHGVITVAFIMMIVSCKWKKWKMRNFVDEVCPGLLIAQVIGRWGNFFNQEAHGSVVGGWVLSNGILTPNLTIEQQYAKLLSLGVPKFIANNMCLNGEKYYYGVINGVQSYGYLSGYAYYHPTFLYESLLNLIGFILYLVARKHFKKVRSGMFGAAYLIWYGVVRFFIEFLRTDSLYIDFFGTPIKNAQAACVLMVVVGIAFMVYLALNKKDPELYQDAIKKGATLKAKAEEDDEAVVKVSSQDGKITEKVIVKDKNESPQKSKDEEKE